MPMPGAYMVQYHLEAGLIPSNIGRHPSEHGVGIISQNNTNISNDNQIDEIRNTLLHGRKPCILAQRIRPPLYPVSIFHGDIPGTVISRKIMIIVI